MPGPSTALPKSRAEIERIQRQRKQLAFARAKTLPWYKGKLDHIDANRLDDPEEWVRAQTNRAPVVGTQTVAGAQWTRYARQDKLQNSMVLVRRGLTTVVTGTAGFDELGRLAASLRPAP